MILKLQRLGLLWPLLFSCIGVLILVMLGNWQMQRKAWKKDLITLVETRLKASPLDIETISQMALEGQDVRYHPGKVSGQFDFENERHYFLPLKSRVGWHMITPFKLPDGDVVFIDRGFVPDQLKLQEKRLSGLQRGPLQIEGLVRPFQKTQGFFIPDNDVKNNKWYWRDGGALYDSLPNYKGRRFGFMIDANKSAQYGDWPMAGVTRVTFVDKHLGYALTWYGLALTLIGVFGFFAYGRWFKKK